DFGCYGCCGTINIHTLCGGIAVHMQSCNTDPGGIELLYRCIKFAVFGVESKPAMFQTACALCRAVGFKVPVDSQAHRQGRIWHPGGMFSRPGNFSFGVQIDDGAFTKCRPQLLAAFDRTIINNMFRCIPQSDGYLVFGIRYDLVQETTMSHTSDKPRERVGLQR